MVLLLLLFRPKLEDMNAGGIEVECISSFFSRLLLSFRCSPVNLTSVVIKCQIAFSSWELVALGFDWLILPCKRQIPNSDSYNITLPLSHDK